MTDKEWAEEVARALAGAGLPFRVHATWIEHGGNMCYAELADSRSGKERQIAISRQDFATVSARRDQIVQQLQNRRR